MMRQPRLEDPKHLAFIRQLPCVVCGNNIETQACHVRIGAPRAGKRAVGLQEKPDDDWTLPMCGREHDEQHKVGELKFWGRYGIDPIFLCLALRRVSGNIELGEMIVRNNAPAFV